MLVFVFMQTPITFLFVCLFNGIKKKPKGEDCIFVKNKLNKGNLWVTMVPPFFSENFA